MEVIPYSLTSAGKFSLGFLDNFPKQMTGSNILRIEAIGIVCTFRVRVAFSGARVLLQDVTVSPRRHIHCHLQHTLPPGVRAVVTEAEVMNFAE